MSLSTSIWLFVLLGLGCLSNGDQNIFDYDTIANNPQIQHLTWANEALNGWDIGLATNRLGTFRNVTPGYVANPRHWITVADEVTCDALGLPSSFGRSKNGTCALNGNVVGLCSLRIVVGGEDAEIGQIVDTTIAIERGALSDGSLLTSAEKQAIFTHEVGHCLGLQHWGNMKLADSDLEPGNPTAHMTHIMYPKVPSKSSNLITPGQGKTPKAVEIAAIGAIYEGMTGGCSSTRRGTTCPSPRSLRSSNSTKRCGTTTTTPNVGHMTYEGYKECYYSVARRRGVLASDRAYHPYFPTFTISASIGNAFTNEKMPPLGAPIQGEVETFIFAIKRDGSEERIRITSDGTKRVQYFPSTGQKHFFPSQQTKTQQ